MWVEYWYNTTYHISLNTTLFHVVYDRPPPPLILYGDQCTPNADLDQQLAARDQALSILKDQLAESPELPKEVR